jgi:Bacterial alpha-L-rhamnosidase C-terminal domain
VWPNVVQVINGFYARHTLPDGLLFNDLGPSDYAFVRRRGMVVAYYNAEYAYALTRTAQLAIWLGDEVHAAAWRKRAHAVATAFGSAFCDSHAGAFADTTTDFATHPQDGNAFAVLAGLATGARTASALDYLWDHDYRSYGNAIVDDTAWDSPTWGIQANQRVYPFMSYFEVCARFEAGGDTEALDLIRREWGYMLAQGPGTMWESIGPAGGPPTGDKPSFDAGWSSGAAPALTRYVLGVVPTSPGFATFAVTPHVGDLEYAEGNVPTPHGRIRVAWKVTGGALELGVSAPPGTRWERTRTRLNPRLVGS